MFITGTLKRKLKFCSATKNDQNAKNVSIITVLSHGIEASVTSIEGRFLLALRRASRTSNVLTLLK